MIAASPLPTSTRKGPSTPYTPITINPANEIALPRTGRDYVSWSALSTYRNCPLKYRFRYVDRLPEEFVSAALVFGTGIHTAVEQHFQMMLAGEKPPSIDQLMLAYRTAWLPHEPDQIQYAARDSRQSLDALAAKMLTAFQQSSLTSISGSVLGVEEELRGSIATGMPDLLGRIDLLSEDDDRLLITDFKTSRGKWSQEQVEGASEQLLLYATLASTISPGKQVAIRFLVLTKTKEPVIEEHTVAVDEAQAQRSVVAAKQVWQAIENGHFYPAPSPMACAGCGYREACRQWPDTTPGPPS